MNTTVEQLRAALDEHDAYVANCSADKVALGEKSCPLCGASSAEPCWRKVSAAGDLVTAARAIADAEQSEVQDA